MRFGDLDKLKSEFEWLLSQVSESSKDEIREVIERIDNAPTADVVEVVRCKYCKWNRKTFKDAMFSRCLHPRSMTLIENQDTHFCGYGERRTDG